MKNELLVAVMVYNEQHVIDNVLKEVVRSQDEEKFDVLIVDDGSKDNSGAICKQFVDENNWSIITKEKNKGIGDSIRKTIEYARINNYKYLVIMSGNGKTKVTQLKNMYSDVITGEYDYIKGSRYIEKFDSPNLPIFRKICIPIYSAIISILMRKKITDITCLINAINLKVFDNPKININQDWLDKYEMEYYILYYIIREKYKMKEVQMTIKYPETKKNYSKIKPFSGWWSMIRPWILLIFRLKK